MKAKINHNIKMPKNMFTALMLFDWSCSYDGKKETTEEEVKAYIRDKFNDKLASMFKPEYLDQ